MVPFPLIPNSASEGFVGLLAYTIVVGTLLSYVCPSPWSNFVGKRPKELRVQLPRKAPKLAKEGEVGIRSFMLKRK